MNFRFFILIASLSMILNGSVSYAQMYVMGLRHQDEKVLAYAKSHKLNIIKSETVEFDNGNTFVRVQDEIMGKSVALLLPQNMDSDAFVEALIKIRTLSTNGAQKIIVALSNPNATLADIIVHGQSGAQIPLDILSLLTLAGADYVFANNKMTKTPSLALPRREFADGEALVYSPTHPKLAIEIARQMGLPFVTSMKHISLDKKKIIYIASMPEPVNENLLDTLSKVESIKALGATVHLVTPYLPYARSDKIDQEGVTITGKLVADLIATSGADSVTFVRAHAPQSQGFFNGPTIQVNGRDTINKYLHSQGVEVFVAPDAGAQKDTSLYAKELGLPVVVANKQRDPKTGKTTFLGFTAGTELRDKVVVIVDDETASGGTLAQTADELKKAGAQKVIAVVTHLAGTAEKALNCPSIDVMVVTDTYPVNQQDKRLVVLSVSSEISKKLKKLVSTTEVDCEKALTNVMFSDNSL